jgi:RNA polymerase sigma-70 factor (family 1)
MMSGKSPNLKDDEDFIKDLYLGDKESFENFYKTYYKRLYIVAYQYTKHQEQSEEIVHDVFLKIWDNASQLRIVHSLEGYLYRSIINASLNYIKKEKNNAQKQEKFAMDFEEGEIVDEGMESLESRLILIEQALDQLPAQCKKVMMMSKFDKYKQQEIADSLNISIKTVKNHLTYGYKKIKLFLADKKVYFLILLIGLLR